MIVQQNLPVRVGLVLASETDVDTIDNADWGKSVAVDDRDTGDVSATTPEVNNK